MLAYYKRHHPEWSPCASHIDWDITNGERSEFLPTMKSDIFLSRGDKTIIIDTKYYVKTMQTNFERTTYISANLYQIYAYVMNHSKGRSGNVSGVLLYAKTDETITPDENIIVSGNSISVKTLGLDVNFADISKQLSNIVTGHERNEQLESY